MLLAQCLAYGGTHKPSFTLFWDKQIHGAPPGTRVLTGALFQSHLNSNYKWSNNFS